MIKKVVLLTERSQVDFLNKLWLENNLESDRVRFCKDGFIGGDESTLPIVVYWACGKFSKYEWDRLENARCQDKFITFDKFVELKEIKAMNLDKIETQEEKEAFECVANSSEVPNSSEWGSGDTCIYKGNGAVVIGWHPLHPVLIVDSNEFGLDSCSPDELSKPETPEQKSERESNEKLLREIMRHDILHDAITHLGDFADAVQVRIAVCENEENKIYWTRQLERINGIQSFVNKTNYRKQNG